MINRLIFNTLKSSEKHWKCSYTKESVYSRSSNHRFYQIAGIVTHSLPPSNPSLSYSRSSGKKYYHSMRNEIGANHFFQLAEMCCEIILEVSIIRLNRPLIHGLSPDLPQGKIPGTGTRKRYLSPEMQKQAL